LAGERVMAREPGLDRYQARYRLTGRVVAGLAASVLLVALVFVLHLPVVFLPLSIVLAAVIARDAGLIDCVRRATAFRADRAGVKLGALPEKLSVRRGSALFIPWADIEGIILIPCAPEKAGRACHGPVRRSPAPGRCCAAEVGQRGGARLPGASRRDLGVPHDYRLAPGHRTPRGRHRGGGARCPHR
jgi:hypothetical protein